VQGTVDQATLHTVTFYRENALRRKHEARDSEESILPFQNLDLEYNSVLVTTHITMERE
jgi:hypothetical protein